MKNIGLLGLLAIVFSACSSPLKNESTAVKPSQIYNTGITGFYVAENENSSLQANFKDRSHNLVSPSFKMQAGQLAIENDALVGGSFIFNSNFEGSKIEASKVALLTSPSWFAVANHPEISLRITIVNPYMTGSPESDADTAKNKVQDPNITLVGLLKMKDTSIQVSFPAKFTVTKSNIDLLGSFYIERSRWKVGTDIDTVKTKEYLQPKAQFHLHIAAKK
jgi:polyisoprenoid-binding protein YceI